MTTKYYIYPYTQHSAGSIMLSEELDGKRVKLNNSTYKYKPEHVLINWGNGNCPFPEALNPASAINEVINKRTFFEKMQGSPFVPAFATTLNTASSLKFPVVCRTNLEGHDGQGIVVAETVQQLVNAALYVEYVDKTSEYRIHVGRLPNGDVTIISRQKKYKTDDFTGDSRIWTGQETKLDYIGTAPVPVITAAREVFAKFPNLTFGAFDIVYDNSAERAYVLEINSAPMMTTSTTKDYADFFRKFDTPTTTETIVQAATTTSAVSSAPAPTNVGSVLFNLVKSQLAAGHISKAQIEAATPKPTDDVLIQNYVNSLTA